MSANLAIGLDLGGTDLKAGLVDGGGSIHHFMRRPSRVRENTSAPLEVIADCVRELAMHAKGAFRGIGLGTPGTHDQSSGMLVGSTPHLPFWNGFPLRSMVETRLESPVRVDNDANLAALAESRFGAARGARLSLTITVGTGVGCGIVADGKLVRGAFGGAGELGHLPIGSGAVACRCGVECCVEPEISGSGLVRGAEARGVEAANAAAVVEAARAGDAAALVQLDAMGESLGRTIATAINLLNPDVVVLGGGVSQAGELLFERVNRAIERYALPSHREGLRVVPAALGERAGVAGAAAQWLD